MSETMNEKSTGNQARDSMNKNTKAKEREESFIYGEQINRIRLMMQLMAPSFIKKQKNQRKSQRNTSKFTSLDSPLYQALNMDLTSYQTLKQLIIENKSLVKELQSAYFLSKQSQKLINFIDGWNALQNDEYFEQHHVIDQSFVDRRASKQSKKRQAQLQQQESKPQDTNERILKKKQLKKLSSKPALIIEQDQQKQDYLIEKDEQQNSNQDIQIQIQTSNEPITNQNNINSSNIILVQRQKQIEEQKKQNKKKGQKINAKSNREENNLNKSSKVIKLYSNTVNLNNFEPAQDLRIEKLQGISHQEIADLSEIIRPQYQKTEISFSSSSQLSNSRQTQGISLEQVSHQMNPPMAKKKTIPLLKKGKSSLGYNELIQASKLSSQPHMYERQEQISVIQATNQHLTTDKGFVSQDTDANSRISILTNKPTIMMKKSDEPRQFEGRRSLSPKVQNNNRRKVFIKKGQASLEQNRKDLVEDSKDQGNLNSQSLITKAVKETAQKQQNRMDIEIKQLEEKFMNRKAIKQSQNLKQLAPEKSFVDHSPNENQTQDEQQLFTKPAPKQNKTLKLIKKSSSSISLNNQQGKESKEQRIQHTTFSHYPLTNANNSKKMKINMQKHSVVLEEEPWECDQLELEEELKALDEKIVQRKSMLSAKQHLGEGSYQGKEYNNPQQETQLSSKPQPYTHTRFNSTQPLANLHSHPAQQTSTRHKRSNTLSSHSLQKKNFYEDQLYQEHLFEETQELFGGEVQQKVQHQSNQPIVVRFSLTALANNHNHLGRKSRQSVRNNDRRPNQRKSLKKDISGNNLRKEPSCKSILLYEQAEKRGISPSKSVKSLKGNNKKSISPIKQYTSTNTQQNQQRTPRNQPPNYKNANIYNPYYQQELTPTSKQSHSRTLSQMVDSEYSRAQKFMNAKEFLMANHHVEEDIYPDNLMMRRGFDEKTILNHTNYERNDTSTFSNCDKYFDNDHGCFGKDLYDRQKMNSCEEIAPPAKKWNVTQNKLTVQKKKFVLLSDQLGDC